MNANSIPTERKAFLWLLCAWTLSNFVFVLLSPFCLVGDEAQYWDWSRRLALGYYSKPPLIAYLIAGLVALGGNREWVIRSGAVLFSSGTLALIYALTTRVAKSERAGLLAALITLATPLFWAGSVLMTPDAPLVFFWALALYASHRAVRGEPNMWYLTGLALGLGMLSKYTMAILGFTLIIHLMICCRSQFRTKGPYVAGVIALLSMSGVLYWNWTRDWVSLRHTLRIGAVENLSVREGTLNVLEFLGGQAGVVSPILFVLTLWAIVHCGKRFRADADAAFLFLCFAVLFLFYLGVSFRREPEANWAACAYLAGIPALAWQWEAWPRWRSARVLLAGGLILGVFIGLAARTTDLAYALGSSSPDRPDRLRFLGLTIPPDKDPTNRLYGPRELGEAISKHMEADPEAFLFSDRYQVTAQLAFYTKGRPRTYCMNFGDRRLNQYDLWRGWDELAGRDGIYVTKGASLKASGSVDLMVEWGAFDDGEVLETVEIRRGDVLVKTYTICRLRNYSGYDWTPPEVKW